MEINQINQINQINHSGQVSIYTPLSPHTSIQPHLTTKLNLCKFNFWVFFFLEKNILKELHNVFFITHKTQTICVQQRHTLMSIMQHTFSNWTRQNIHWQRPYSRFIVIQGKAFCVDLNAALLCFMHYEIILFHSILPS